MCGMGGGGWPLISEKRPEWYEEEQSCADIRVVRIVVVVSLNLSMSMSIYICLCVISVFVFGLTPNSLISLIN